MTEFAFSPATVVRAWDETPGLRGLSVRLSAPRETSNPGQALKIQSPMGEGFFALASLLDGNTGTVDLLLKRGAAIADAVIAAATPGASIETTPPLGNGFPVAQAHDRDLLVFAAGSGIAPTRALLQHVARERARFHRVTLFYGQRAQSDFAYRAEYLDWERSGIRVVLCASASGHIAPDSQVLRGRVHQVAEATHFCGGSVHSAVAFVCGMKEMVSDVKAVLAGAGLTPDRVHLNF
jgi:NAD(P)H-flavin reductase